MKYTIKSLQKGGRIEFPGVKYANPYLVPEHNIPKVGDIILPDTQREELIGTDANEYKIGIGVDGKETEIPTIVGGQYLGIENAIKRFQLTKEKFKPMRDPSSYSRFYDIISRLGIMKHQKGKVINKIYTPETDNTNVQRIAPDIKIKGITFAPPQKNQPTISETGDRSETPLRKQQRIDRMIKAAQPITVPPNAQWMYPNITNEQLAAKEVSKHGKQLGNAMIDALPIGEMGKLGKINRIGNTIIKNRLLNKPANIVSKSLNKEKELLSKLNGEFKSEINWGKWNKEIPDNKALMKEYNAIEQKAKANGTWMKNNDGSAFQGTPEQFVQQNSKNFKKAFPKIIQENGKVTPLIHHSRKEFNAFDKAFNLSGANAAWYGEGVYTIPEPFFNKRIAHSYKDMMDPNTSRDIVINYGDKRYDLYANDINLNKVAYNNRFPVTNSTKHEDIFTMVSPYSNQLKSAVRNNGMFDMTNPDIYKSLIPIGLGVGIQNKSNGGKIDTNMIRKGFKSKFQEGGRLYIPISESTNIQRSTPNLKFKKKGLPESTPSYIEETPKERADKLKSLNGKTKDEANKDYMNNPFNLERLHKNLGEVGKIIGMAGAPLAASAVTASSLPAAIGTAFNAGRTWLGGASMMDLANAGFATHGIMQTPNVAKDWVNVAKGKGDVGKAVVNTANTAMELSMLPTSAFKTPQLVNKFRARNIPVFRKAPITIQKNKIVLTSPTGVRPTSHFTLDIPVQSHKAGNWDGETSTLVMPWKKIRNLGEIKSIEPSDVIIQGRGLPIKTKGVKVISGDKSIKGVQRISSERLEDLYTNIQKAKNNFEESSPEKIGGLNLSKPFNSARPLEKEYADEVMNISQKYFPQPTLKQFKALEKSTGLKSGVIEGNAPQFIQNVLRAYETGFMNPNFKAPKYPNGEKVMYGPGGIKYANLHENQRNLIYHPASSIDMRLKKAAISKKQEGGIIEEQQITQLAIDWNDLK